MRVSALRRAALSVLKNETGEKVGIKTKRILAASGEDYFEKALVGK